MHKNVALQSELREVFHLTLPVHLVCVCVYMRAAHGCSFNVVCVRMCPGFNAEVKM